MNLGTRLKTAREQRGLSVRDLAQITKLSVFHLDALERGDFGRLPAGIFGRGIVRAYANEVGLSSDELVKQFIEEWPTAVPESLDDEKSAGRQSSARIGLAAVLAVVVLLAIVVGAYMWGYSNSRSNPPEVESGPR